MLPVIRVKFGVLEQTQGLHLPAKFHLNVFIVSASGNQKPQFWANFDIFRSSSTDPLLPIWVKFGVLEQTQGLHLPAKFHLNMFIVLASGGQKPQFWANFDIFGGSCTDPLSPMRAKFGVLEQTQGLHLHAKFHQTQPTLKGRSAGQRHTHKPVGYYGPIAFPGPNVPSSECPPNTCHVKGVAKSLCGRSGPLWSRPN